MIESSIELFNSEWFSNVLEKVGFYCNKNKYPRTQYGLIKFLEDNNIKIKHINTDKGWQYHGINVVEKDCFTEDMNYYPDFDDCVNTSVLECICYLANCKN